MKYKLALKTGGLMEDPEWHYENILVIESDNLYDAKNKYAELTYLVGKPDWNAKQQTYWGWQIVVLLQEEAPCSEVEKMEKVN